MEMDNFVINGRTYRARDVDFEFLVVLDKAKVSLDNITGMAATNCYLAYCGGLTEKQASDEITQHIIKGGAISDLVTAYAEKVQESDFFRALMESTANETPEEEGTAVTTESPKKKQRKSATD